MRRKLVSWAVLVTVALCSVFVGILITTSFRLPQVIEAGTFWKEASTASESQVLMPSLKNLARAVTPTVVNIRTTKSVTSSDLSRRFQSPPGGKDWFDEFFRRYFDSLPDPEDSPRSLGSGFIITRDGYVLTNNHVISNADEIIVTLSDEEEFEAKIVGRDDTTDIALIRIESDRKNFPEAVLGNSDAIDIGDWVIAIGNPFGFGHTLTHGIVSAKSRVIGAGLYDNFIQTDAAINPGNSGGPLLNMQGQVVGINTAIVAAGQGIGFAIPINMAKEILSELRDTGEVSRGWLGVAIQDLTPELARAVGLEDPRGAMVTAVYPDDPADRAGVKAGDVILKINHQDIKDPRALTRIIGALKPESEIIILVWRDEKAIELKTTLQRRDEEHIASLGRIPNDAAEIRDRLGLVVKEINPEVQQQYGIEESQGILIVDIDPDSIAANSSIQKMDIIKEIGRIEVGTVKEYLAALEKMKTGQTVLLLVVRESRPLYVAVDIE
ncbi:MAG: DegQ family serine endoprotease [Desulfomonilia bacterium]|nr:DegQ family serine endoprotease [Desulfomonilia bacterium]